MAKNESQKISLETLEYKDLIFDKSVPLNGLKDHKGKPLTTIMKYWRRHGLTPFLPKGGWNRISFSDLIWLRMLDDMRRINFPMELMKEVCKYFFEDAYRNNLPKVNLEESKRQLEKKRIAGTLLEHEEIQLNWIKDVLQHPPLLHLYKFSISYLTNLIAKVAKYRQEGTVMIFFSGEVREFIGGVCVSHRDPDIDYYAPHITLSINYYFKEFLDDQALSTILMPKILNDDEIKVIREIRNRNVDTITISLSPEGKLKNISTSKTGSVKSKDLHELVRILATENYVSLKIDSMDGKTFSFTKARKKI